MPAPTTTAELLDLVSQSGLADEAQLRAYVENLTETGTLPTDPLRFAAALLRDGFLTYFHAEQLLQGKWKRFALGKYTVLEKLASGTSGTYFLCEHTKMPRVVAIKVLPFQKAEDTRGLEQFYREARALAACDHPNIVRAYDLDQDDCLHFLVTEYIDGSNLLDVARRGPLDPIRAAHYITQAAAGLQYAHALGLVHRNVKPSKLTLERSGRIVLCGMSLALFLHDARNVEEVCGTPNYIAPEQTLDSARVDHRADIYSLGGTFYHLLTGKPPFTGISAEQKMLWHQTREPSPIQSLRPEVPDEMARVVERMMGKNPASRYQSAAEVAAALEPWCNTPISPPTAAELPTHCPRVQEAILRASRPQL